MTTFSMRLGGGDDDDDDDEERELDRRIDQAFSNARVNAPTRATDSMPSAHVEAISRQFRANPTKVLAESIPPEEKPDDIYEWDTGGRIQAMVDFHKAHQERLKQVSQVALRQFAELVNASINISQSSSHSDPIRVYLRPDHDYTSRFQTATVVASGSAAAGMEGIPVTGPGPTFSVTPGAGKLSETQDYRYAQAVRSALDRVEVTGEFTLSPVIYMGVERSLESLNEQDPEKFKNAVLDDFLHDAQAMRLMAFLCSAHITNTRIKNPSRYYLDKNENRRTHEIREITQKMTRSLFRSELGQPFEFLTSKEQKQYLANGDGGLFSGLERDETGAIYERAGKRRMRRKRY